MLLASKSFLRSPCLAITRAGCGLTSCWHRRLFNKVKEKSPMTNIDTASLILLLFAALGVLSHNASITIAVVFLLLLRSANLHQFFSLAGKARSYAGDHHPDRRHYGSARQRQNQCARVRPILSSVEIAACRSDRHFGRLSGRPRSFTHVESAYGDYGLAHRDDTGSGSIPRGSRRSADCRRSSVVVDRKNVKKKPLLADGARRRGLLARLSGFFNPFSGSTRTASK